MSLLQKLEDPYLRAMFAFLTCDRENYEEILVSLGAFIVYFTVIIYRYQACNNRGGLFIWVYSIQAQNCPRPQANLICLV